jgi:Contractile injection system tube protein
MAGKFIKGALIEFMETFLLPLPNVISFQFNPETMTHAWTQSQSNSNRGMDGEVNPLAVSGFPTESFSFNIMLDSNESIADQNPISGSLAKISGVYSRIAALEMLQYPVNTESNGLLGSVTASLSNGLSLAAEAKQKNSIPLAQVPTVLFVWGAGRIVPVRVTSLSITEKLYDSRLNPIHAEAQLGLRVLTPAELKYVAGPLKEIAKTAYDYSQELRQSLAIANLDNAAESIIGMLPF